ncbi:hypothetical protein E2562_031412 [Oryza meyeriana var. granulata]|uniref:Pentacotripeptide-repeat region of PRORP domain-containing protein n=1 Tax=Oryza meyeriana var. granulata TaxID=110450 RepID=A0A6G1C1P0_9ORYZ|nr:hypothetical protein E2562_031412 [Oryza meyeriana var. granulata]
MARAGHHGASASAPSSHTYGIAIDCCRRVRRPDLALAAVARLLRAGLGLDAIASTNLLRGLFDAGRTEEALDLLVRRMPALGCVPDVISYGVLLKGLCNARRSQQACEMLRKMSGEGGVGAPNVYAYNTVVDGFFKEGKVHKAYDLFHEMIEQGTSPDVATYNSIIDGLCKSKAMDKAESVLEQMVHDGVRPDNWTYNCLINGYCTSRMWKDSVRLFKEMSSSGLKPDICSCTVPDLDIFNMLIDTYAKCGMVDEAMHIYEAMQKQGLNPNVVTCNTVISAFCRLGRLADAVDKFNEMTDLGVPPNPAVYQCLIHVSGVLTVAARTLPGEEWLPEDGVVRAVVEMLVGSKSGGGGGGTHCC